MEKVKKIKNENKLFPTISAVFCGFQVFKISKKSQKVKKKKSKKK